jgi:hypothetical protein
MVCGEHPKLIEKGSTAILLIKPDEPQRFLYVGGDKVSIDKLNVNRAHGPTSPSYAREA